MRVAPDADFLRVMAGFMDLNAFMVHVAVENFLADEDGIVGNYGVNNFYFYRLEGSTRSAFIPWDKSEAFKGGPRQGREIVRQHEQIRTAVLDDPYKPHSNDEFDASIGQLLDFARMRSELVRDDVARSRR